MKPLMQAPTTTLTGIEAETETDGTESDPLQNPVSLSDPLHSSAMQALVRIRIPSGLVSHSPFQSVQGPHPSQSISSNPDPAGHIGPTASPLRIPPDPMHTLLLLFLLYLSHGVHVDQQPQSPVHP